MGLNVAVFITLTWAVKCVNFDYAAPAISCIFPSAQEGKEATLTCMFQNINKTSEQTVSVNAKLARARPGAGKLRSVLMLQDPTSKPPTPNVSISQSDGNNWNVSVRFLKATKWDEGKYGCQLVGPGTPKYLTCQFTLDGSPDVTTASTQDEKGPHTTDETRKLSTDGSPDVTTASTQDEKGPHTTDETRKLSTEILDTGRQSDSGEDVSTRTFIIVAVIIMIIVVVVIIICCFLRGCPMIKFFKTQSKPHQLKLASQSGCGEDAALLSEPDHNRNTAGPSDKVSGDGDINDVATQAIGATSTGETSRFYGETPDREHRSQKTGQIGVNPSEKTSVEVHSSSRPATISGDTAGTVELPAPGGHNGPVAGQTIKKPSEKVAIHQNRREIPAPDIIDGQPAGPTSGTVSGTENRPQGPPYVQAEVHPIATPTSGSINNEPAGATPNTSLALDVPPMETSAEVHGLTMGTNRPATTSGDTAGTGGLPAPGGHNGLVAGQTIKKPSEKGCHQENTCMRLPLDQSPRQNSLDRDVTPDTPDSGCLLDTENEQNLQEANEKVQDQLSKTQAVLIDSLMKQLKEKGDKLEKIEKELQEEKQKSDEKDAEVRSLRKQVKDLQVQLQEAVDRRKEICTSQDKHIQTLLEKQVDEKDKVANLKEQLAIEKAKNRRKEQSVDEVEGDGQAERVHDMGLYRPKKKVGGGRDVLPSTSGNQSRGDCSFEERRDSLAGQLRKLAPLTTDSTEELGGFVLTEDNKLFGTDSMEAALTVNIRSETNMDSNSPLHRQTSRSPASDSPDVNVLRPPTLSTSVAGSAGPHGSVESEEASGFQTSTEEHRPPEVNPLSTAALTHQQSSSAAQSVHGT